MTAAAFRATIHGLKTVPTRKVCQLTVEFPIEQLAQVALIAEHGAWVGIARLTEGKEGDVTEKGADDRRQHISDTPPRLDSNASAGADKPAKSPAQIAGYLCTLGSFHTFLRKKFTAHWNNNWQVSETDEETAKQCIYDICTVTSRRELTDKNTEWHALQLAFRLWQSHPELEDVSA